MPDSASQVAALAVTAVQGAAWIVWILLALVVMGRARRAVVAGLAAVTVGALVLRLAAPAVQHDLNDRLNEIHRRVDDLSWLYTHGLVSLVRVGAQLGIAPDDVRVFHLVALLGALSVPVAYVVTRRLGGGVVAGAVAAVVLGGTGLHVRYSHTDAPQIVEGLLTLVGAAALLVPRDARTRVDVALAVVSLSLAATCRPEAVVVPLLVLVWSTACGAAWSWRTLAAVVGGVWIVDGLDFGLVVAGHGGPASRNALHAPALWVHGPSAIVTWHRAFVPVALGALALVGAWLAPSRRAGLATLALSVVLGSLVLNPEWSIAANPSWCVARHQLRVVPWMAVLVGLGVGALTDVAARRLSGSMAAVVRGGALAGVAVLTASTLPDAYAHFTLADEYTFFRAALLTVPDDCHLLTIVDRGVDHGLMVHELPASLGRSHAIHGLDTELASLGDLRPGCVVYYRSALCSAVHAGEGDHDFCAAFEARTRLTPLVEGRLGSRGWLWETYREDPVRVGFYRVEGVR